jgi:hypothetical protein
MQSVEIFGGQEGLLLQFTSCSQFENWKEVIEVRIGRPTGNSAAHPAHRPFPPSACAPWVTVKPTTPLAKRSVARPRPPSHRYSGRAVPTVFDRSHVCHLGLPYPSPVWSKTRQNSFSPHRAFLVKLSRAPLLRLLLPPMPSRAIVPPAGRATALLLASSSVRPWASHRSGAFTVVPRWTSSSAVRASPQIARL